MPKRKEPPRLFGEPATECTNEPIECHFCWRPYNKEKKKEIIYYVEWDGEDKVCECCFPHLERMAIVHSAAIFTWITALARRSAATIRQESGTVPVEASRGYPRRVSLYNENSRNPVEKLKLSA